MNSAAHPDRSAVLPHQISAYSKPEPRRITTDTEAELKQLIEERFGNSTPVIRDSHDSKHLAVVLTAMASYCNFPAGTRVANRITH